MSLPDFDRLPPHWKYWPQKQRLKTPTVLLVHGFMGSPEDFNPIAERLSQHYSCIAPCLKGHLSPTQRSLEAKMTAHDIHSADLEAYTACTESLPYGLPAQAQAIEAALASAHIDTVYAIGYSLGGRVLLEWALSPVYRTVNPANPRLKALCLTASHVGLPPNPGLRQQRFIQDIHVAQRLEAITHSNAVNENWEAFLDFWYGLPLFGDLHKHAHYAELKRRRREHDPLKLAAVVVQASNALQRDDRENLAQLAKSTPCLYIAGSADPKYANLATELSQRNIPTALLPNMAHAIPVENSMEYGNLLTQFLAGLRQ